MQTKAIGITAGNKAYKRPGSLRRSARPRCEHTIIVAGAVFTPAAIGILDRAQPLARTQHMRFAVALPGSRQPAQSEAGAVNIGDSPAAVPASVGFLVLHQPLDAPPHRLMITVEPVSCQSFQSAPGDIRATGVQHGVV